MKDFVCYAIVEDVIIPGKITYNGIVTKFISDAGSVINWRNIEEININLGYYAGMRGKGKTSERKSATSRANAAIARAARAKKHSDQTNGG